MFLITVPAVGHLTTAIIISDDQCGQMRRWGIEARPSCRISAVDQQQRAVHGFLGTAHHSILDAGQHSRSCCCCRDRRRPSTTIPACCCLHFFFSRRNLRRLKMDPWISSAECFLRLLLLLPSLPAAVPPPWASLLPPLGPGSELRSLEERQGRRLSAVMAANKALLLPLMTLPLPNKGTFFQKEN